MWVRRPGRQPAGCAVVPARLADMPSIEDDLVAAAIRAALCGGPRMVEAAAAGAVRGALAARASPGRSCEPASRATASGKTSSTSSPATGARTSTTALLWTSASAAGSSSEAASAAAPSPAAARNRRRRAARRRRREALASTGALASLQSGADDLPPHRENPVVQSGVLEPPPGISGARAAVGGPEPPGQALPGPQQLGATGVSEPINHSAGQPTVAFHIETKDANGGSSHGGSSPSSDLAGQSLESTRREPASTMKEEVAGSRGTAAGVNGSPLSCGNGFVQPDCPGQAIAATVSKGSGRVSRSGSVDA